jgi:protein-disulfide isomerase/uncharacterized membrane protein
MNLLSFRFHPHVQAVARLLRCLNVKVHHQSIEQQLEQHPDWPSLLCVSDALHQWNIPHLAAKAADRQLPDTHFPLLAVTNHPERPLAVVTGVSNGKVQFYQYSYAQPTEETAATFVQRWTGVYLLAEANERIGEPDYRTVGRQLWRQQALPMAAIVVMLLGLVAAFWPRLTGSGLANMATLALFALYIAGLAVSGLLLWHEIDQSNPFLKKVCTGLAKTNCNAILNSKASKLFGGLSWSDVGFAYFAGGLLLLAMPAHAPWALLWLAAVGLAALAYPVFSIYYQWRVAKQWCALCLAVQAILLLQGAVLWMSNYLPVLSLDTFTTFLIPHSLLLISAVYLLPLLAWLSLKPLLKRWQTAKQEQRAYRRLKFNPDVFAGMLQKQKAVQTSAEGLGITLGPADAPHQLLKVCNPYCGPCSQAHPKIEKLLHQHSNLQVKILFMVADEPGQRPHTAASHLMAIAQNANSQQQVQQALDDWYLADKKDYDAFAAKYRLNGEVAAQAPSVTAMEKWSLANDIRYTPTIFFNGNEMPPEYDLEDLSYFLQE